MAFSPPQMGQAAARFREAPRVVDIDGGSGSAGAVATMNAALAGAGQVQRDAATARATNAQAENFELDNEATNMQLDAVRGLNESMQTEQQAALAGQMDVAEQAKQKSMLQLAVLESLRGNYGDAAVYGEMAKKSYDQLSMYAESAISTKNPGYAKAVASDLSSKENIEAFMLINEHRLGIGKPVTDEQLLQAYNTVDKIRASNPTAYGTLNDLAVQYSGVKQSYENEKVKNQALIKEFELRSKEFLETQNQNRERNALARDQLTQQAEMFQMEYGLRTQQQALDWKKHTETVQQNWAQLGITAKNSKIAELAGVLELKKANNDEFYRSLEVFQKEEQGNREYFKTITTAMGTVMDKLQLDPNDKEAQEQLTTLIQAQKQAMVAMDKAKASKSAFMEKQTGDGEESGTPGILPFDQDYVSTLQRAAKEARAMAKDPKSSGATSFTAGIFNLLQGVTEGTNEGVIRAFTPDMARQGENLLQMKATYGIADIDGLAEFYRKSGNQVGLALLSDPVTKKMILDYVDLHSDGLTTK